MYCVRKTCRGRCSFWRRHWRHTTRDNRPELQVPFEDTSRGMCDPASQWHCFHEQVTRNIPEMIAFSGFFCIFATHIIGKMLEWLKRHAWKACSRLKRLTGSNPVLSAKAETCIQAELVRAKVQVSAFASPRRRRSGMCERSEQIPRKEREVRAGGTGCAFREHMSKTKAPG